MRLASQCSRAAVRDAEGWAEQGPRIRDHQPKLNSTDCH